MESAINLHKVTLKAKKKITSPHQGAAFFRFSISTTESVSSLDCFS